MTAAMLLTSMPVNTAAAPLPQTSKNASGKKTAAKKKTSTGKKPAAGKKASGGKKASAGKKAPGGRRQSAVNTPRSSAEAKKMREAAERDIRQTKEKIRLNEQEVKAGLSDLNRLSSEITTGRNKVAQLEGKVGSLQKEITVLGGEIEKNEAELARMREEYLKAVKKMRLTQKNRSAIAFIFASDDFNQAMRRIRYMRQFSDWKERKSADIDLKIRQLGEEKDKLAKVREMHASTLGQLTASQQALEAKHKRQEELVANLRQNGDMLQSHLSSKQNEANRLNASISALIAQEQAKAEAERKAREQAEAERRAREKAAAEKAAAEKAAAGKAAAEAAASQQNEADRKAAEKAAKKRAEEEKKAAKKKEKEEKKAAKKRAEEEKRKKNSEKGSRHKSGRRSDRPKPAVQPSGQGQAPVENVNFAALRGSLPRPVDGGWRVTNPFGRHAMPGLPDVFYDNPGIDAEVAKGTAVKTVCGGKVSGVYKVSGYNTVVIVNHGDYYTVYGNLSSASVSVGQSLGSGRTVGTAAADPDNPGQGSVHFEVWKGREKQNPESWLR